MNIKSVAHLSGVSEHTLRAWERRYQVVLPDRSEGGRRLYSTADVEKLKLLALLVDRGHAISTLARLSTQELTELAKQGPGPAYNRAQSMLYPRRESLLHALELLDFDELDRQILRARMDSPARAFVLEVVSPLLFEVGRLVAESKLDIAQEHALSTVLRNHLGELIAQLQKANPWDATQRKETPGFLFATAEGDLHEFGILLAAILTGSRGLSFRYLGPNMPAASLAKAAATIGAKIVVLGSVAASTDRLVHPLKEYVHLLKFELNKGSYHDVSVWIGGYCDFTPSAKDLSDGFKHIDTLVSFDRELEKIENQVRPALSAQEG
jgi:DNA-binding transcriptional MerR regulator